MGLLQKIKLSLMFLLPAFLWGFLYKDFFIGKSYISEDTFAVYAVVKYFLSNLSSGVFAHWNPYIHWGMGHVCQVGEFNPIWLLVLLFNTLGVDFYYAFLWTIIMYMFFGVFGVYKLLRFFIKDSFLCYLGFLFFLFSGFTMSIFTQITIVLIFVPSVWFFYFLCQFAKSPKSSSMLWMVFMLMLIMTTYIPFYFLTVFLVFISFYVLLFPKEFLRFFGIFTNFMIQRPWISCFALLGLVCAVGISFSNWLFLKKDFVVLARSTIVNFDMVKGSGILISEILRDHSIFSVMIHGFNIPMLQYSRDIFTLDNIAFDAQRIFYLPFVCHILILLGIFNRISKRILLVSGVCFVLFMIAIANLTPLYEFLFRHLIFFKMFRNIFLLIPYIAFFYIFWSLVVSEDSWEKLKIVLGKRLVFIKIIIIITAIIQPYFVLSDHARKFNLMEPSDIIKQSIKEPLKTSGFSFIREISNKEGLKPNDVYRKYNWHIIAQKDTDSFISKQYGYPTVWSNQISSMYDQHIEFADYVRHKFILFNTIYNKDLNFNNASDYEQWFMAQPKGEMISGNDQGIRITRFNANQLHFTTSLIQEKFLVYNDSYHPFWKAYINDKPTVIKRSQFAFKGIMLPKGEAKVRFEFIPFGGVWIYGGVLGVFYIFFLISLYVKFLKKE